MSSLNMHNITQHINQTPENQVSFAGETEFVDTPNEDASEIEAFDTANEVATEIEANVGALKYETITDMCEKGCISDMPEDINSNSQDDDYNPHLAESDRAESGLDADVLGTGYNADKAESDLDADPEKNDDSDPDFNADESETDSNAEETDDDDSDPDFTLDENDSSDDEDDMKYNMQCEACTKKMYVKNPASAEGYKCPDCCGDVEVITSMMKKTNISGKKKNAPKIHQCDMCLQYFSSDASVNIHKLYCSKGSDSPSTFTDAASVEASNGNPYQCEMCHKSYKRPGALKRHMKVHENDAGIAELDSTSVPLSLEELNTCYTPSKRSEHHSIITKKVLVVTEDDDSYVDTYQCEYCNKRYASKGYLMRHIKAMHTLTQSVIVM